MSNQYEIMRVGIFVSHCSDRPDGPNTVLTNGTESYFNRFSSDGDQLKVVPFFDDMQILVLRDNGDVEVRNRRGLTLREL